MPREAVDRAAKVLEAVVSSVDRARLAELLASGEAVTSSAGASIAGASSAGAPSAGATIEAGLASRMVLADLLDDSILGARPGDPSFPLRALFGDLGAALQGDDAFALAALLNVFFRVEGDEETRMRVGLDASRYYYRFARSVEMPRESRIATSPLLAQLLSTQLERVRFESVDHERLFDGGSHERAEGADAGASIIQSPTSFLCRVSANGVVRVKAGVTT